jgi:hypothetical protein
MMLRHPVALELFWTVLEDLPVSAMESFRALRLIEFLRFDLNVASEFGQFLDSHSQHAKRMLRKGESYHKWSDHYS